jgi:hypothetical protein
LQALLDFLKTIEEETLAAPAFQTLATESTPLVSSVVDSTPSAPTSRNTLISTSSTHIREEEDVNITPLNPVSMDFYVPVVEAITPVKVKKLSSTTCNFPKY